MTKKDNMLFCFRCYHTWKRRKKILPKNCPKCHSPYWDKPRKSILKGTVLEMRKGFIDLHDAIIKISGGEKGVREDGGIYNSTYKLLNHQNKYRKEPIKLGALIINEFAKRHYFVDGNKRTAYAIAKIFMLINKCHLQVEYGGAAKFIREIAKHNTKINLEDIREWLKDHCVIIDRKDIQNYLNQVFVNLSIGENPNAN